MTAASDSSRHENLGAGCATASGVARYSVLRSQTEIIGAFGSRAWIEFVELR
jgi:hypothetical protein